MNIAAQYLSERRRRLGRLSLARWWLTEYLGRGLIALGAGGVILGLPPESLRTPVAIALLVAGLLIVVLSYGRKQPPIEVRVGEDIKR